MATSKYLSGRAVSDTNRLPVLSASPGVVIDIAFSADTAVLATGDVIADTQVITDAVRALGGFAVLQSVTLLDQDDAGVALDMVFFNANTSLGPENSAPDVTDSEAIDILGIVSIIGGDYIDLGGARVATLRNIGLMLQAKVDSDNFYIALITRGTPTYATNGLKAKLGFLQG